MGITNNIMKPSLVQRHTRIHLYKTLARPVTAVRHGTLKKKDESRITANEMKFMRYTAGYTKWDHKRNEDVMEELQLEPVITHVKHYRNNWINHLHRMLRDRISKVMLHYRPNGKRSLGRPKKRWIENSTVRSNTKADVVYDRLTINITIDNFAKKLIIKILTSRIKARTAKIFTVAHNAHALSTGLRVQSTTSVSSTNVTINNQSRSHFSDLHLPSYVFRVSACLAASCAGSVSYACGVSASWVHDLPWSGFPVYPDIPLSSGYPCSQLPQNARVSGTNRPQAELLSCFCRTQSSSCQSLRFPLDVAFAKTMCRLSSKFAGTESSNLLRRPMLSRSGHSANHHGKVDFLAMTSLPFCKEPLRFLISGAASRRTLGWQNFISGRDEGHSLPKY
ncbi:hypothetical protein ANN_15911 [Periplaneta americana]|uniref:Uncharacterized protein n=1 Tax=Periplaneta americana TaxID=6978 RepID=A0ABQ8SHJ3_PERAM|nr:hypothetical protein ANN_15911 [Periplaneta americana]